MIKVLGFQRIAILLGLLALNGLFGAAAYMHFIPQKEIKSRELSSLRGQTSTLQGDIEGLMIEFEQLDKQREEFEVLKKDGFFDGQSRRKAELIFQKIQERSGVVSAVASIAGGEFEENAEAAKASHKILRSPVMIRIEAVSDLDIYRYIYLVNEFFPGNLSIRNLKLNRESDLSGVVLRAIASGQNPPLVTAEMELYWRTMIPESSAPVVEEGL